MTHWAIDIETYPDMDTVQLLDEVKASKTLKDPVKIKADIEKKQNEQVSKMALSPEHGKIACIGMFNGKESHFLYGDEKKMIMDMFKILDGSTMITFNGLKFDIPFIIKRGLQYGVTTLDHLLMFTDKFKSRDLHIDLMERYCEWGQFISLDKLSKIYLGRGKVEFDFTRIPELIKTEVGLVELEEYCMNDVFLTHDLAGKFGFIDEWVPTVEQENDKQPDMVKEDSPTDVASNQTFSL